MSRRAAEVDLSGLSTSERLVLVKRIIDGIVKGEPGAEGPNLFSWEALSELFTKG